MKLRALSILLLAALDFVAGSALAQGQAIKQDVIVIAPVSHASTINAIAALPELNAIATASDDGTIRIWNAGNGEEVGLPHADYTHQVLSVSARPLHKTEIVAAFSTLGSSDSYVALVELATGALHKVCAERARDLRFSPDGTVLAVLGSGQVSLWNVATGKQIRTIKASGTNTGFVDDNTLAVQSEEAVSLINIWTGKQGVQIPTGTGTSFVVDHNSDLLFHLNKKTVSVWSVSAGTLRKSIELLSEVQFLAYDPVHQSLFAGGFQSGGIGGVSANRLYRISGAGWTDLEGIDGPDDRITTLSVSGGKLMVGEQNGKVLRFRLNEDLEVDADLGLRAEDISSFAISAGTRFLAAGDRSGLVHVWEPESSSYRQLDHFGVRKTYSPYFPSDPHSRGVRETFTVGEAPKPRFLPVLSMAFVGNSTKLAIFYGDGHVVVEDVLSEQVFVDDKISGADLTNFLSIGETTLIVGSAAQVHLWDLKTGQSHNLDVHVNNLRSLSITTDQQNLIVGGRDGVEAINMATPSSKLRVFRPQFPDAYKVMAIGNESTAILSETHLIVWNFTTEKVITSALDRGIPKTLLPDLMSVPAFYIDSASRSVVSAGAYGIHAWNWEKPKSLRHVEPGFSVTAITETPDGKAIVAGGRNGRIEFFDLSSGNRLGSLYAMSPLGWYACTAAGQFDGSPSVWDRLVFARASRQLAVLSSPQVFRQLYTPSLISQILQRKTASSTVQTTGQSSSFLLSGTNSPPPGVTPPRVQISAPDPTVTVGHGKLQRATWALTQRDGTVSRTIPSIRPQPEGSLVESGPRIMTATVTVVLKIVDGGGGLAGCKLFRNRQLIRSFEDLSEKDGKTELSVVAEMLAGNVEFSAYCFDSYGIRSAIARSTVVGDDKLRRERRAFVLSIGIDVYQKPELRLNFAQADADLVSSALHNELSKSGEFEQVIPVELLNRDATSQNILMALRCLAGQCVRTPKFPEQVSRLSKTTPDDAVFLYFAGHGGRVGAKYLLLANDFQIDRVSRKWVGAVTDLELAAALGTLSAGKIVVIIDACESGSTLDSDGGKVGPFNFKSFAQMAYDKGIFAIAATQSNQAAREVPRLGHGLFTYILAHDGLRAHLADWQPPDGRITAKEWLQYALAHHRPATISTQGPERLGSARPFSEDGDPTGNATSLWEQTPRLFLPDVYSGFDFVISKPPGHVLSGAPN